MCLSTSCVFTLLTGIRQGGIFSDHVLGVVNPFPPTLLCRDFKTVFDCGMDRLGSDAGDSPHDSSAPCVLLFHVCGVVEVWRSLHPSDRSFTWVRPNGSFASWIDLIGVPVHWLPSMNFCEICPCSYSAQCTVILSAIVPQALSRGPGICKLDISVLKEEEAVALETYF